MTLALRPAEERDRTLLVNLFNLYQNDLSAYCGGFCSLDDEGYFDKTASVDALPFGDGVYTYIITLDGRNIGLILVTDARCSPDGCDYYIQELYLVRAARGKGLGAMAVDAAMRNRHGVWGLVVYKKNAPARGFWEKLIASRGRLLSAADAEDDMIELRFEA